MRLVIISVIILNFCSVVFAQEDFGFGYYEPPKTICISPQQRTEIEQEVSKNQKMLLLKGLLSEHSTATTTLLAWPLKQSGVNDYSYFGISNYVDLDNTTGLKDYNCGTRTYDGHQGLDIFTFPYAWDKMDNNNVEVIAAAAGTITYKSDGNFDRQCQWGNNGNWNAVFVQHADGTTAWYGHLKNGSLTSKTVGQTVQVGEYLGIVGSSGFSSGPHLHFELKSPTNQTIDPYDGACNAVGSRWLNQRAYNAPQLVKLMTHSQNPNPYPACIAYPIDNTYEKKNFVSGETVRFTTYYQDQVGQQTSVHRILRPNGTVWVQFNHTPTNTTPYFSSYWYWTYTLPNPADTGTWKFEVTHNGKTYETFFNVNTTVDCPTTRSFITPVNEAVAQFKASGSINATSVISPVSNLTYKANAIQLAPGFEVKAGNVFQALTGGCN